MMKRNLLQRFSPAARRRAMILVLVMWVSLGLITMALYFGNSITLEYKAADNEASGLQANQAINAAERYTTYLLANLQTPGIPPSLADDEYVAEEVPVGDAKYWMIGRDANSLDYPTEPVFGLVDESSKLNVNTATLEMLELLPGMTPELAAAIIDWRDADSDVTEGGAEAEDYQLLDPPYYPKNADFESVDELRMVLGMDMPTLYGEDANRNGVLDPNEDDADESLPEDNSDGKLDPGIAEYLTCWSRQPNTQADGSAKVNITAQGADQQLASLMSTAGIADDRAQAIIAAVGPQLASMTSPLEFYKSSGMTPDEYALVESGLTIVDGDYQVGLVNVRTAPAPVLACLPGMTEALAEQLIATRSTLDATALESSAWVGDALDLNTIQQMGPFITSRTYQYSADVVAMGHEGHGYRREFMVFDAEDPTAVKTIYRRDLSRLTPNPLGKTLLQRLKDALGT